MSQPVVPPRVSHPRIAWTDKETFWKKDAAIITKLGEPILLKFDGRTLLDSSKRYITCKISGVTEGPWSSGQAYNDTADPTRKQYTWKYAGNFVKQKPEDGRAIYYFDFFKIDTQSRGEYHAYALPDGINITTCQDGYLSKCTSSESILTYDPKTFTMFFPARLKGSGGRRRSRKPQKKRQRRKGSKRTRR